MPSDSARAAVLAALPQLGLPGLPAQVTRAVVAYTAALALRPPDPPPAARAVIDAVAVEAFAAAAAKGSDTITIDPQPVAAARAAEAAHADHAQVLAAIRDRAPLALCTIVDQHRAQIIGALQAKHAEVLGQLVPAAHRLPDGIADRKALELGGQVRTDFLATEDLAAQAEQLRAILTEVENVPGRGQPPDGLEISLTYLRDTRLYDGPRDAHGEPGSRSFYRSLGRETEPGDWWLPTRAQQHARAGEVIEARRREGLAEQMPRGATVW
jgi:hypothetical protein